MLLGLVSCGGDSTGTTILPITIEQYSGVAQKGPFEINSPIVISLLDSSGIATGNEVLTKVKDNKGGYLYSIPKNWNVDSANGSSIQITVTGFYRDEFTGKKSAEKLTLRSITDNPNLSSVNVLTNWLAKRNTVLLEKGKTLKEAIHQSEEELGDIFGTKNSRQLDISQNNKYSSDSALLLLISGALMEVAQQNTSKPQTIINEIAEDFSDDGKLTKLGKDWLKRMQAKVRDNPKAHTNQYAKALFKDPEEQGVNGEELPEEIPLASRPSAVLPSKIFAKPNEKIVLDGSLSHDNIEGSLINYTWFRVDQQTQFNAPVSNQFSVTPSITVPSEESELLYALVVTDNQKDTDTAVIKVVVKVPTPNNIAPKAEDLTLTTQEDTPIEFVLVATDDEDSINDILSYNISNHPTLLLNGLLENNPDLPELKYSPTKDFNGDSKFTFTADDGSENSNIAVVSIKVTPVNDAPIADAGAAQEVTECTEVTLNGSASSDIEDGSIVTPNYNWSSATYIQTFNGSTTAAPTFIAPPVNRSSCSSNTLLTDQANKKVTFSLVVRDSENTPSEPDEIVITIVPENQPPTAQSATVSNSLPVIGGPIEIDLSLFAADPEEGDLSYEILKVDDVVLANANLEIPIKLNFTNSATGIVIASDPLDIPIDRKFTYQVTDDHNNKSSIETITVKFTIINQPPIAGPVTVVWDDNLGGYLDVFGNETGITLMGFDPEGSALQFKIISLPDPGFLQNIDLDTFTSTEDVLNTGPFTSPHFIYGLDESALNEPDSFQYIVIDDKGLESEPYTVTIPLQPMEAKIVGGDRSIIKINTSNDDVNPDYTAAFVIEGFDSIVPPGGGYKWDISFIQPLQPLANPPMLSSDAHLHNDTLNVSAANDVSGEYKITLTVTNGGTRSHSTSVNVKVSTPPVAKSYSELQTEHNFHIDLGDVAQFSISSLNNGYDLGSDADGDSITYKLIDGSVSHDDSSIDPNIIEFSLNSNGLVSMRPFNGKGIIKFDFIVIDQFGFSSSPATFEMLYLTGD